MLLNETKIILDLCGGTGAWSKPYADAGYDVRVITLPEDVRTYVPPEEVYSVLAAPPCAGFSVAKDHKISRDLGGGMDIVNACIRIIFQCKPMFWALENPAGLLRKFLGDYDYAFQPWWFGDPWTKLTNLWGKFNKPTRKYSYWEDVPKNEKLYVRPRRTKPSIAFLHKSDAGLMPQLSEYKCDIDTDFRAITPPGFAKAFFEANP